MYGKWENGLLFVSDSGQDGYNPMVLTEKPIAEEGYVALFYWDIGSSAITQTWEVVAETEEELPDDETVSILIGEAAV